MITALAESFGNHLWQSTLFALCAAGLALMLRGIPSRTRYWIWFAASLKFLVPFSALLSLGSSLASIHGMKGALQPAPYYSLDVVSQPFTFTPIALSSTGKTTLLASWEQSVHFLSIVAAIWAAGSLILLCCWIIHWRRMAIDLRNARPAKKGIELSVLQRVQALQNMRRPIAIAISDTSLEPGIFGIWRPTLVWPQGISKRLNETQIEGIIAHEIAHAQRRDNLTAALHMLVQVIFWFHPIAWWLQRRLLEERERACDEAVMGLGGTPEVYAEGVLRACRFSVGSPEPFTSGISGSDLAQRVRRIVSGSPVPCLTRTHKLLLIGLTALAVLSPILFGFVDVPRVSAALLQNSESKPVFSFEVATVKLSSGQGENRGVFTSPGRFRAENWPLKNVIMFAYNLRSDSQISGYPGWVNSTGYDIDAKTDENTTATLDKLPPDQRVRQVKLMVQALLAERFHLRVSYQTREIPVYALVTAKGGPKLMKSTGPLLLAGGGTRSGIMESKSGELEGINSSLDQFAAVASDMPEVDDRVVVNKTGLAGNYNWTLKWTPGASAQNSGKTNGGTLPAPGSDDSAPSLFTALQEQLGLKLESQKGSVETLVVDSIDKPTVN
jgi:bla regulator protein blaR1